jgi:tripartite-type tricarboxylate transporter receptor subunit TctC
MSKERAMQRRTLIQAAAWSAAALAAPRLALAQEWPTGPVRIVVGFPPGGGTDALARVVGTKLTEMWKQQVLVENRAGVAGVLAAEYTATQPSDGSVLLMPDVQERLDTFGAEDGGGSSEKFAGFIKTEIAKWTKVVKDGNVKVDS